MLALQGGFEAHGKALATGAAEAITEDLTLTADTAWLLRGGVFIGDDVTDEDGFRAANRMGGLSIRVGGAGETAARYRIDTVERLIRWLEANLLEAGHDDAWGAPNAMPHQTAV